MKKFIALLIIIIVILIMSFTYIGRYIFWNFADVGDYKKFPSMAVHRGGEVFHFRQSQAEFAWELPGKFATAEEGRDMDAFLANHQTLALIVIRNDTLLTEKYFDGFSRESVIPVFSVAKSVVSALVGIALDEGTLSSVNDPITRYVTGFKHKGFGEITLEHFAGLGAGTAPDAGGRSSPSNLAQREMTLIREVLDRCGGDTRKAAQELGISRATLYRKIKKS